MDAETDESRYVFSCPSCGGSFSLSIEKIPPVRARFACPKCGKAMDFPSRDEARVVLQLQAKGGEAAPSPKPPAAAAPAPTSRPASPPPPPPRPLARPPADPPPAPSATPEAEKRYTVNRAGFEDDSFDRRAMRTLIRTGAVNENDPVSAGGAAAARADTFPELKTLFELRKTARTTPPPVCRKHIEVLAHFVCADTGRPLCEDCAPEKKFGGTTVRVCAHCGGTARELHAAPGDLS